MSAEPRRAHAPRLDDDVRRRALSACAEVTAGSGSNFYLAFLPLPRERREGMFCVYAFCRRVDDVVDEPAPGSDPRAELAAWRRRVQAVVDGEIHGGDDPIAIGLAITHARFGLRVEDMLAVIDGVEMDLDRRRLRSEPELALYCERVAGRVGCLCLPVFGASDASRPYALALGHAFQLTNILRDVARDAREGRFYLPEEEMIRFGVTEADLLADAPRPAVRELLHEQGRRAYELLQQAEALLVAPDRPRVYPAQIMAAIYRRLLETMEAAGHDTWLNRPRLPTRVKAMLAIGVFLRDRVLRLS